MTSPFLRREEADPIADVNVVPLADVSLVLLIILLVLSPMAAQSMLRVQAAAAADETKETRAQQDLAPQAPEPTLAVELSASGYKVSGHVLGGDAKLKAWLEPELQKRKDKKVFLSPELETSNGLIVHAIETISGCGASAVALVQAADSQSPTAR